MQSVIARTPTYVGGRSDPCLPAGRFIIKIASPAKPDRNDTLYDYQLRKSCNNVTMKQLPKFSLLGVSITTSPRADILSRVSSYLSRRSSQKSPLTIVTPNPEQIVLAQKDEDFCRILNQADVSLPDGAGVVWAIKKISNFKFQISNFSRISGIDFMMDLCRIAAEKNMRVLLYGGRGGVAQEALNKLKQSIPHLDGIAMNGPEMIDPMHIDPAIIEGLIRMIRSRNIRVVFIGLGAPKQEFLIGSLRPRLKDPIVMMVVGGAFDILAGKIQRAPKSVQTFGAGSFWPFGLEFIWRLFHEPWRWKRQLLLLQFLWLVMRKKQ